MDSLEQLKRRYTIATLNRLRGLSPRAPLPVHLRQGVDRLARGEPAPETPVPTILERAVSDAFLPPPHAED